MRDLILISGGKSLITLVAESKLVKVNRTSILPPVWTTISGTVPKDIVSEGAAKTPGVVAVFGIDGEDAGPCSLGHRQPAWIKEKELTVRPSSF